MKNIKKFILAILPFIGLLVSSSALAQATTTAYPDSLCFGCVVSTSTSLPQTTLVAGAYLTPSSGQLTVTAPTNYSVSDPASGTWGASYTIAYSGGFLPSRAVMVQFTAPATAGTYTGNVSISGGGMSVARNIHVSGTTVSTLGGSCICSGTPSAGNIVATDTAGCAAFTSTMALSGFCMSSGISFQWQTSTSGGATWANVSGATDGSVTLTFANTTEVRCAVTCSSGGATAYTAAIHMAVGLPTSVYPIVGLSTITLYGSTALADATPGGTWSSSSPSVATVTASGAVYGVSVGSAVISYSVTDTCGTTVVTKTITVTGTLSENGVSGSGLSVTLAPNPAAGFTIVNCSLGTASDVHITLRDLTGRVLISRDAFINQLGSTGLSLPGLAPGVYIVEVAANGEKVVKMLMAQ